MIIHHIPFNNNRQGKISTAKVNLAVHLPTYQTNKDKKKTQSCAQMRQFEELNFEIAVT